MVRQHKCYATPRISIGQSNIPDGNINGLPVLLVQYLDGLHNHFQAGTGSPVKAVRPESSSIVRDTDINPTWPSLYRYPQATFSFLVFQGMLQGILHRNLYQHRRQHHPVRTNRRVNGNVRMKIRSQRALLQLKENAYEIKFLRQCHTKMLGQLQITTHQLYQRRQILTLGVIQARHLLIEHIEYEVRVDTVRRFCTNKRARFFLLYI